MDDHVAADGDPFAYLKEGGDAIDADERYWSAMGDGPSWNALPARLFTAKLAGGQNTRGHRSPSGGLEVRQLGL